MWWCGNCASASGPLPNGELIVTYSRASESAVDRLARDRVDLGKHNSIMLRGGYAAVKAQQRRKRRWIDDTAFGKM